MTLRNTVLLIRVPERQIRKSALPKIPEKMCKLCCEFYTGSPASWEAQVFLGLTQPTGTAPELLDAENTLPRSHASYAGHSGDCAWAGSGLGQWDADGVLSISHRANLDDSVE